MLFVCLEFLKSIFHLLTVTTRLRNVKNFERMTKKTNLVNTGEDVRDIKGDWHTGILVS